MADSSNIGLNAYESNNQQELFKLTKRAASVRETNIGTIDKETEQYIDHLLALKIDFMVVNGTQCTPLCTRACRGNHHPLLVAMLNCNDTKDEQMMAAKLQNLKETVDRYSQANGASVTQLSKNWCIWHEIPDTEPRTLPAFRWSLGHWAAALGHVRALQWLILQGFSMLTTTKDGMNMPLHIALTYLPRSCLLTIAITKFAEMLPLLWPAIGSHNREGYLPIHIICGLVQNDDPRSEFYIAALDLLMANGTYTKKFRRHSMRVMCTPWSDNLNTPLHQLAMNDAPLDAVHKLLYDRFKQQVHVNLFNIKNSQDLTPLDIAQRHGNQALIQYYHTHAAALGSSRQREIAPIAPTSQPELIGQPQVVRKRKNSGDDDKVIKRPKSQEENLGEVDKNECVQDPNDDDSPNQPAGVKNTEDVLEVKPSIATSQKPCQSVIVMRKQITTHRNRSLTTAQESTAHTSEQSRETPSPQQELSPYAEPGISRVKTAFCHTDVRQNTVSTREIPGPAYVLCSRNMPPTSGLEPLPAVDLQWDQIPVSSSTLAPPEQEHEPGKLRSETLPMIHAPASGPTSQEVIMPTAGDNCTVSLLPSGLPKDGQITLPKDVFLVGITPVCSASMNGVHSQPVSASMAPARTSSQATLSDSTPFIIKQGSCGGRICIPVSVLHSETSTMQTVLVQQDQFKRAMKKPKRRKRPPLRVVGQNQLQVSTPGGKPLPVGMSGSTQNSRQMSPALCADGQNKLPVSTPGDSAASSSQNTGQTPPLLLAGDQNQLLVSTSGEKLLPINAATLSQNTGQKPPPFHAGGQNKLPVSTSGEKPLPVCAANSNRNTGKKPPSLRVGGRKKRQVSALGGEHIVQKPPPLHASGQNKIPSPVWHPVSLGACNQNQNQNRTSGEKPSSFRPVSPGHTTAGSKQARDSSHQVNAAPNIIPPSAHHAGLTLVPLMRCSNSAGISSLAGDTPTVNTTSTPISNQTGDTAPHLTKSSTPHVTGCQNPEVDHQVTVTSKQNVVQTMEEFYSALHSYLSKPCSGTDNKIIQDVVQTPVLVSSSLSRVADHPNVTGVTPMLELNEKTKSTPDNVGGEGTHHSRGDTLPNGHQAPLDLTHSSKNQVEETISQPSMILHSHLVGNSDSTTVTLQHAAALSRAVSNNTSKLCVGLPPNQPDVSQSAGVSQTSTSTSVVSRNQSNSANLVTVANAVHNHSGFSRLNGTLHMHNCLEKHDSLKPPNLVNEPIVPTSPACQLMCVGSRGCGGQTAPHDQNTCVFPKTTPVTSACQDQNTSVCPTDAPVTIPSMESTLFELTDAELGSCEADEADTLPPEAASCKVTLKKIMQDLEENLEKVDACVKSYAVQLESAEQQMEEQAEHLKKSLDHLYSLQCREYLLTYSQQQLGAAQLLQNGFVCRLKQCEETIDLLSEDDDDSDAGTKTSTINEQRYLKSESRHEATEMPTTDPQILEHTPTVTESNVDQQNEKQSSGKSDAPNQNESCFLHSQLQNGEDISAVPSKLTWERVQKSTAPTSLQDISNLQEVRHRTNKAKSRTMFSTVLDGGATQVLPPGGIVFSDGLESRTSKMEILHCDVTHFFNN